MSSPSLIFVLAEDQLQKQLIYRFLVMAGVNPHQMTIEVSPAGQGSGEQWVRKNFARQVSKCRARNARHARTSTSMFVMLDADRLPVQEHLIELDTSLISANQPRIDEATDSVARLIPKWSIETWILYLGANGALIQPLSEDQPYKHSKTKEQWAELVPQASKTLFAWTRTAASRPRNLLDSLQHGLAEIPRALPVGR